MIQLAIKITENSSTGLKSNNYKYCRHFPKFLCTKVCLNASIKIVYSLRVTKMYFQAVNNPFWLMMSPVIIRFFK